ncbi:MAG: glycosyltransferase family 39 protein [Marinicaulis sp.]|nr:glycosyltransferase family 39 protein [Marinicaulis sp.]NNE40218.1 glycosyltransferase family 39 protein [Marinicaulis sp.]NNL88818.1 glycosyltransferase family 39 protein [Marinicaulis sp.]
MVASGNHNFWVDLALVTMFAAFVGFAGAFSMPPLDRDEARFAQATVQMLETGDFVNIRFQDKERNKKPVGIHWLQAASVSLFSDVERREIWAFRLPSIIGAVIASVFTFLCALRMYDRSTAMLAGFLIASAPLVAAEATIAKTDGVLLAMICMAQFAFLEIYACFREGRANTLKFPVMFWVAQCGAILIKGPIGPIVSAATGFGLFTEKPRFRWLKRMRLALGFLILLILVAPWLIAIGVSTDGRYFSEALGVDMAAKLGAAQENHNGLPGYHAGLMWILFWPASALILPGLIHIWNDRGFWQARFLLAWIIPFWILFEIAATKLPHYVLPVYPALAIVAAHAAVRDGNVQTNWRRMGAGIYLFVGMLAAFLICAGKHYFSEGPISPIVITAAVLIAAASIMIAWLFWRGRAYAGGIAASCLAALFAWILYDGVLPTMDRLAVSPRISTELIELNRHPIVDDTEPVALAGYAEPSAVFLLGTQTQLTTGDRAGQLLASGEVSAAIVDVSAEDYFQNAILTRSARVKSLATVSGLNYSNGKPVDLKIYILDD